MISKVYEVGALKTYKYVVVLSTCCGKIMLSRHKARTTWETQGGHVEPGEAPLEAAKRELYEETGAQDFDIMPLFDYAVDTPASWANGQVFFVSVRSFGPMPDFEMAQIAHFETYPEKMRFPSILPELYRETIKRLENQL